VAGANDQGEQERQQLAEEDAELIREFVQEAEQHFVMAESALLTLEKSPEDPEAIGVIFRAFHTVKGVSSLLGLGLISQFSHQAESFLIPVRDGVARFVGEYPALALEALDMLRSLMGGVASGSVSLEPPPGYVELARKLVAGARSRRPASPAEAAKLPAVKVGAPAASLVPRGASRSSRAQARSERAGSGSVRAKARPPPADGAARTAGVAADAWIRVRAERLDALLDMVSELVISQSMVSEDVSLYDGRLRELHEKVNQCGKIVRGLQDLSLTLRMVPLRATFQKMGRVVRDTAHRSHKQAELVTLGEDTEVDRKLADVIADPLVHMVRNAVDHGIEPAEDRVAKGKPAVGRIELSAHHAGGNVVIVLRDDGRGLARDKIVAKAKRQGLVSADARLSDAEILSLIFMPGFSTSEAVTDISGRGVGMDVVKRAIESLSGRIEIASHDGLGSTFSIHLPLTLAITDGMLVRVGRERYIIPTANIEMSFRPEPQQVKTLTGSGEMVMLRGAAIPMLRVHQTFHVPDAVHDPTRALVVVVGSGGGARALLVDDLLGKYQVVTKSLGAAVAAVPGVSGGAILGDGHVGLVIDPQGFIRYSEALDPAPSPPLPRSVTVGAQLSPADLGGKHLTFFLDQEEYGVPILQVQEIVRLPSITPVPNSAPHLRGVANLRGRIFPILDLRARLGMDSVPATDETRVIVITSELGAIGIVVDRVSEVEDIDAGTIGKAPAVGTTTEYVRGVGISGDRAQFLLDVERVVGRGTQGGSSEAAVTARG
jgi:two-component system, chemotaxis family, sensor kinase CheA